MLVLCIANLSLVPYSYALLSNGDFLFKQAGTVGLIAFALLQLIGFIKPSRRLAQFFLGIGVLQTALFFTLFHQTGLPSPNNPLWALNRFLNGEASIGFALYHYAHVSLPGWVHYVEYLVIPAALVYCSLTPSITKAPIGATSMNTNAKEKLVASSENGHYTVNGGEFQSVTMFNVFAANPSKPASLYVMALFTGLLVFLGCCLSLSVMLESAPLGFILGAIIGGFAAFLCTRFSSDEREQAHDTRISVSAQRVLRVLGDAETQVPVENIRCFSLRSTLTGEITYVETHFSGSSVVGNGVFGGLVGEGLMGTRAMPGAAGITVGGMMATATAATNVAGGVLNMASNGLRKTRALHKQRIAEHSYVVQVVTRDDKRLTLAGGLNRDTANDLMHGLNSAIDHAFAVEKKNQALNV